MLNPISSPGDPLFYIHHAFIDKLWWDWQSADLDARLYSIGGPNVKDPERPAPIPDGSNKTLHHRADDYAGKEHNRYLGDNGNLTTLSHKLSLLGLLPDLTAADVMDIGNELLCYKYS
jgi:tyrosinase